MTNNLNADKAMVIRFASTIELNWVPNSSENLMAKSWLYFPLYIMKIGTGVNLIRLSILKKQEMSG